MGTSWKREFEDSVKIKFDGLAVENHLIDAKKLSFTLNGLTKALNDANNAINGRYSHISLKVPCKFEAGSFEFDLISFFSSNGITAFVNILALIGIGGQIPDYINNSYSLIKLLRITKGNKIIENIDIDDEYKSVYFENSSGPITVNKYIVNLYGDNGVINGLIEAFKPLEDDGIDKITFSNPSNTIEEIKKQDLDNLKNVEKTHPIKVQEYNSEFEVIAPQITGSSNNWRLRHIDESNSFSATILDEKFLDQVRSGKYPFIAGTFIHANCRKTLSKKQKIVNKYEILEVYDVDYINKKPMTEIQTNIFQYGDIIK